MSLVVGFLSLVEEDELQCHVQEDVDAALFRVFCLLTASRNTERFYSSQF